MSQKTMSRMKRNDLETKLVFVVTDSHTSLERFYDNVSHMVDAQLAEMKKLSEDKGYKPESRAIATKGVQYLEHIKKFMNDNPVNAMDDYACDKTRRELNDKITETRIIYRQISLIETNKK